MRGYVLLTRLRIARCRPRRQVCLRWSCWLSGKGSIERRCACRQPLTLVCRCDAARSGMRWRSRVTRAVTSPLALARLTLCLTVPSPSAAETTPQSSVMRSVLLLALLAVAVVAGVSAQAFDAVSHHCCCARVRGLRCGRLAHQRSLLSLCVACARSTTQTNDADSQLIRTLHA